MKLKNSTLFFAMIFSLFSLTALAQNPTNISPETAMEITTFPFTDSDVNTSLGGGISSTPQGGCFSPCCSVVVYKIPVTIPGTLRIDNSDFVPLAGSFLAYRSDVENPTAFSDLKYTSEPGNFCGFRDSLQMSGLSVGEVIYVIAFNHNSQTGQGKASDFVFDFYPDCPVGSVCAYPNVAICEETEYESPTGKVYNSSGSYIDTLTSNSGGDSLIYTNLKITHQRYVQDSIKDIEVCDTLKQDAFTNLHSYALLESGDKDFIKIDSVVKDLVDLNRSVFAWIQHSAKVSGSSEVIVSINTGTGGNVCNLQIGTNEKLGIFDGANSHYSGKVVTDGEWHHVGYTYDNSTSETVIYVDGVPSATYSNNQSISASNVMSIGQEYDSGLSTGNFYSGELTEVTIWNEILDSAEISVIMRAKVENTVAKYENLVAYYPMALASCDADKLLVKDFSSKENDGLASSEEIQSDLALIEIDGYNSEAWFTKKWYANDELISTSNAFFSTSFSAGTYQLILSRSYFSIEDSWEVSIQAECICQESIHSITEVVCDTYTSPSGKEWTTTGVYTDTLINAAECDSVITIDLTVNQSSSGIDVIAACDSLVWIDGITYKEDNDTATFTLKNSNQCDSVVLLNLTINKIDVSVNASASQLEAVQVEVVYQWLDCNNSFTPIDTETNQLFITTKTGNYAVRISNNICVDTSVCYQILGTELDQNALNTLNLYPNPTNDVVTISSAALVNSTLKIYSTVGQLLLEKKVGNQTEYQLQLPTAAGVYLVEITSKEAKMIVKVLKK